MAALERCAHGRYRIDPCAGCDRSYVDGQLVGGFLPSGPRPRCWCNRPVPPSSACGCCCARHDMEQRAEGMRQ